MSTTVSTLSRKQERLLLLGTVLASSMVFIDSTALNVALPALQEELGLGGKELLWVVNSYALLLAALLLTGGALGDLLGRKKIYLAGMVFFTGASVVCGFAPNPLLLIVARGLQGVGGALMVPGSIAILSALFPAERRGWAIGTWSMFSAVTTIGGPALGGYLASLGLWRYIFFINIPLAVVAFLALVGMPETKDPTAKRLDLPGALLATFGLGGVSYGFLEASERGFADWLVRGSLIGGALCLVAFIWVERKSAYPMMPLSLFKSKTFSGTNALTFFLYGALGSSLLFLPLNLAQVQGYSEAQAGLAMLPFGIIIGGMSGLSGRWADRFGAKPLLVIGSFVVSGAFLIFSLPGITSGPAAYWVTFLPPAVILGVGMGLVVAPLTTAVMNSAPASAAGAASGINNALSRMAPVLMVSVVGFVGLVYFKEVLFQEVANLSLPSAVKAELAENAKEWGATKAPEGATQSQKDAITLAVKEGFVATFRLICRIACAMAFVAGILAWLIVDAKECLGTAKAGGGGDGA